MEEIRRLFNETKGLESLAKMYKEGKRSIFQLEDEIDALKIEKSAINIFSVDEQIKECERELEELNREIVCKKIISNKCMSLKELEKALDTIMDEALCLDKCLGFMDNLLILFNISCAQLEKNFQLQKEGENFKVIRLSREIEELFQMSKERPFFKDLESEFKLRVKEELGRTVPFDVDTFSTNGFLYFIFPTEEPTIEDEVVAQDPVPVTLSSLQANFDITINSIIFILKANLTKYFIEDDYTMIDLAANNEKLKGTGFYIENLEEWALDTVMKDVVNILKNRSSSDDVHLIEDGISGKYISQNYYRLLRLYKFIDRSKSSRKTKALAFYNKMLLRFFKIEHPRDPRDAFMMYSDISHFFKSFSSFEYLELISKAREELFYKIIDMSTDFTVDLSLPSLTLKASIKRKQFDFYENLENFVAPKTIKFFKIQFFEKLYEVFLGNVFSRSAKLSTAEKNVLKEVSQYLLDISFEIGTESIANYSKVASFHECIDSTLEEVKELYECGDINLEPFELKMLLRIVFDDSELRNSFISSLDM